MFGGDRWCVCRTKNYTPRCPAFTHVASAVTLEQVVEIDESDFGSISEGVETEEEPSEPSV